ncbi:hypothetical protein BV000_00664B, partial [Haemophilus influenzae]
LEYCQDDENFRVKKK